MSTLCQLGEFDAAGATVPNHRNLPYRFYSATSPLLAVLDQNVARLQPD